MAPNAEATYTPQPKVEELKEIKYIPGQGFKRVVIDPKKKKPGVNWLHVTILIGIPIITLYGILTTPLQPKTLALAAITYFFAGFGITGGYHRLWSHKAWNCILPVKFIVLMGGAAALQGSARWWSRNHRAHHKFTDTTKDPYNVRKGFMWAHFGWMMYKQDPEEVGRANIDDLDADPLVMFQHKYYLYLALFFSIIMPTLVAGFGWGDFRGGYFYAALARIILVHHATFFVNSLAHYLGEQEYSDLHTAFDSQITAILTLGEGYHNYHHEFPQDYRNGIKWFQYDPTKWTILLLWYLGLAYDLKWIDTNEVEKAKLQMKKAHLAEKLNKLKYGNNLDQNLNPISQSDINKMTSEGKTVVVIDGKVYDVSEFIDLHPGGRETILKNNGKEVTALFHGETGENIHSQFAIKMLARYIIGKAC